MNDMLYHKRSRIRAFPDASVTHPDGKVLVRLKDHWFFFEDCVRA